MHRGLSIEIGDFLPFLMHVTSSFNDLYVAKKAYKSIVTIEEAINASVACNPPMKYFWQKVRLDICLCRVDY